MATDSSISSAVDCCRCPSKLNRKCQPPQAENVSTLAKRPRSQAISYSKRYYSCEPSRGTCRHSLVCPARHGFLSATPRSASPPSRQALVPRKIEAVSEISRSSRCSCRIPKRALCHALVYQTPLATTLGFTCASLGPAPTLFDGQRQCSFHGFC